VEALSLGDRVAVMSDGVIVQCAPPLTVYDSPATEFVGGFIGSPPMNFLDARVVDAAVLEVGGQRIQAPPRTTAATGRMVRLGVRAETITAHREERDGALRVTAEVVEPLGNATLVTARLADQPLKVQVAADFPVAPGDELRLELRPERLRLYDQADGSALLRGQALGQAGGSTAAEA
jgi:multiple sugar transport system ATP-binding protein